MKFLIEEIDASKSGIYTIINKLNNRIYIGSTKCFNKRFSQHKSLLRNNKHPNKFLQNDFNQNSNHFEFNKTEIISSKDDRIFVEQTYIDYYFDFANQCYNLNKNAFSREGCIFSKNPEKTREKFKLRPGISKENRDKINLEKRTEKSRKKVSENTTGSKNPNSNLTEKQVKKIRKLWETRKVSQKQIAKKFNLPCSTVNHIIKRYTWKHI